MAAKIGRLVSCVERNMPVSQVDTRKSLSPKSGLHFASADAVIVPNGPRKGYKYASAMGCQFDESNVLSEDLQDAGRVSVDSAYSENVPSMEEGTCPSSIISRHLNRGADKDVSWKELANVVGHVQEKRLMQKEDAKKKQAQLESLMLHLDEALGKAHGLEAEIEPLRLRLKRYEDVIEDLEEKLEVAERSTLESKQETAKCKEAAELEKRRMLDHIEISKFDHEKELQDHVQNLKNENSTLRKEIDDLNAELSARRKSPVVDEDSHPKAKLAENYRKELTAVKRVLETSEQDRLNERREKLKTIQTMIKLTKQKSDLEEELADYKKAATDEGSSKYSRLLRKYEALSKDLANLREVHSNEMEALERKYMQQIHILQVEAASPSPCDLGREQPSQGQRVTTHAVVPPGLQRSAHRDDMKPASDERSKERPEVAEMFRTLHDDRVIDAAARDTLTSIFGQYSDLYDRLVSRGVSDDASPPQIEVLKQERRALKRKVEDCEENLSVMQRDLKVVEMAYKRQIDDLLVSKKANALQMHKLSDTIDAKRDEVQDLTMQLESLRGLLAKRDEELDRVRESMAGVTNDLKNVEAESSKVRRDLAVKDAEIARLRQELANANEQMLELKSLAEKMQAEVASHKQALKERDKQNCTLEDKAHHLVGQLERSKIFSDRVVEERDHLQRQLQDEQLSLVAVEQKLLNSDGLVNSFMLQVASLEKALDEKVALLSATSLEADRRKIELLATQHLLGEEEEKCDKMDGELQRLIAVVEQRGEALDDAQARNRHLEHELRTAKKQLDRAQDVCDAEFRLQNGSETKALLEAELAQLQSRFSAVQRDNVALSEANFKLKAEVQDKEKEMDDLRQKLLAIKRELRDRTRAVDEAVCLREQVERRTKGLEQQLSVLQAANADTLASEISKTSELRRLQQQCVEQADEMQKRSGLTLEVEEPILEVRVDQDESAQDELSLDRAGTGETSKSESRRARPLQVRQTKVDPQVSREKSAKVEWTSDVESSAMQEEIEWLMTQMESVDDLQKPADRLSIDQMKASYAKLRSEMESLNERLRSLKHENQSLRDSFDSKDKELVALLKEMADKDTTVKRLQELLSQQRIGCDEELLKLQETSCKDKQLLLQSQQAKAQELQEKIGELTEQKLVIERKLREVTSLLEMEKDVAWRESMARDGLLRKLKTDLEIRESEKQDLERRLSRYEEQLLRTPSPLRIDRLNSVSPPPASSEKLRTLENQLAAEKEEKQQALKCLKALVKDNQDLATCLRQQQETLSRQQTDLSDTKDRLQVALQGFDAEHGKLVRAKRRLRDVMETSLTRESNISIDQKKQIAHLEQELDLVRQESKDLRQKLSCKEADFSRAQDELSSLRAAVEFNLGSFEAERRAKEIVESQLELMTKDRGSAFHKLATTELTNKILQDKLLSLQRWHNKLEANLLHSLGPAVHPVDDVKVNLRSHTLFIENQLKAVSDKLLQLEFPAENVLNNKLPDKDKKSL